jgi:hypothetical protein
MASGILNTGAARYLAFVRYIRTSTTTIAYESHSLGYAVGDNWNIRHLSLYYNINTGCSGSCDTYDWDAWACSENIGGSSGVYFIKLYDVGVSDPLSNGVVEVYAPSSNNDYDQCLDFNVDSSNRNIAYTTLLSGVYVYTCKIDISTPSDSGAFSCVGL